VLLFKLPPHIGKLPKRTKKKEKKKKEKKPHIASIPTKNPWLLQLAKIQTMVSSVLVCGRGESG